ncbi:lipase family protein [Roseococcus sp.]|uniref:lipase family protein n=1 Tax=Roseococcus sp. TaxID=2109646 RepID=UPI003BAC41C4
MRSVGGQIEFVLSFAGSETTEGGVDWKADLAFGGNTAGNAGGTMTRFGAISPVVGLLGVGLSSLAADATTLLAKQKHWAISFTELAQRTVQDKPLILTGHSLGGGLAQMSAAHTGVAAVTFSAPAVSAVAGVEAMYLRKRPRIVNFRVKNDPVNVSEQAGHRLGVVVNMMSPRSVAEAHQMGNTLAELLPQGQFSTTGAKDPFSFTGNVSVSH